MTNKEIQELVDEQPVYILSCVSARVSKLYEQKWELENRIIKAIEYIEENYTQYGEEDDFWSYRLINADNTLDILKGVDKE